jgi:hypothetical protein
VCIYIYVCVYIFVCVHKRASNVQMKTNCMQGPYVMGHLAIRVHVSLFQSQENSLWVCLDGEPREWSDSVPVF